jgi:hypothetical protein
MLRAPAFLIACGGGFQKLGEFGHSPPRNVDRSLVQALPKPVGRRGIALGKDGFPASFPRPTYWAFSPATSIPSEPSVVTSSLVSVTSRSQEYFDPVVAALGAPITFPRIFLAVHRQIPGLSTCPGLPSLCHPGPRNSSRAVGTPRRCNGLLLPLAPDPPRRL